jgi:cyclohexanecarboxylate-CoA ligase
MSRSITATFPNVRAAHYRRHGHWLQQSLPLLFARTPQRDAGRAGIIDAARRFSFGELDTLSRRAALGFAALGIRPGDVIAYQLPNWWEAVVVFLAALRAGATVNPLLPIFRESELRFTLQQSGARVLVVPGEFRGLDYRTQIAGLWPDLADLKTVVVARGAPLAGMRAWTDLLDARLPAANLPADSSIDPDGVALLMYTSGTTAEPKGVLHTHNSLAAEIISLERVHALTPEDRTLMPSPLTHISGVVHGILAPALLGTSAVLMERWEPGAALEMIERESITYLVGAPTFLQEMLEHDAHAAMPRALRSLRLFSCGGAGVPPDLMRRARERFPQCIAKRVYGSTEFPTITTTDASDAATHGADSEGRPIWPARVRIVDAAGTELPAGSEGEVQASGPECFAGYLDAALNRDAFTADGWFRTGDLGVLDRAGYLRISGRLKEIVIRKGEKISVKEVEDVIAAHPAVAEVAVVPCPDPRTGERACAVVRVFAGTTIDLESLRVFLSASGLAKQKWPEELRLTDDFPRTESGKIQRRKLKELLEGRRG